MRVARRCSCTTPPSPSPVVEEELVARLDGPLGEDADSVVSVHHHHLGVAVGVDGVVGEPDLVPLPRRVHHEIWKV